MLYIVYNDNINTQKAEEVIAKPEPHLRKVLSPQWCWGIWVLDITQDFTLLRASSTAPQSSFSVFSYHFIFFWDAILHNSSIFFI